MAESTLGTLQSAYDLAKNLLNMHDAVTRQATVIELQNKILAAQASALASSQAQASQVNEIRELEEEVARLKAWGAEKNRYHMRRAEPGVLFFSLKPEHIDTEPPHQLCAHCYERGEKSYLQATAKLQMRHRVHYCPNCKSEFAMGHVPPELPRQVQTDYDPFAR
jgi:Zn finger protein HypA/HybF involved in hydrogenase expression